MPCRTILRSVASVLMALVLSLGTVTATPVLAAPGATYYVCVTGDDTTGVGSEGSPWATIEHALDEVVPGDTIIVRPGVYDEDVTIDESLTLRSQGGPAVTTIEGTITINLIDGREVVFGGIGSGFKVDAGAASSGIDVTLEYWSLLVIAGNDLTGNEYGIYVNSVHHFSQLEIIGNTVSGSTNEGIYLYADPYGPPAVSYHSYAAIIDNQITDNGRDAIYWDDVSHRSRGLIQGNTITGNADDGIYFDDVRYGSSLDILGNTITGNDGRGIYVDEYEYGSTGLIQGNTIKNNGDDGLYMYNPSRNGSRVIIDDNTIDDNRGYGMYFEFYVDYGAYLAILDNRIRGNDDGGIYFERDIEDGGEALIQRNTITSNGGDGIYINDIEDGGSVVIDDNTIDDNRGYGLYMESEVYYGAYLEIVGNSIRFNDDGGICLHDVTDGAEVLIHGNTITDNGEDSNSNGGDGIYIGSIQDGSRVIVEDNVIKDNEGYGFHVYDVIYGSYLELVGNEIRGNEKDGIHISGISSGGWVVIQDNNGITNNEGYGVYLYDMYTGGKLDIERNTITGNKDGGVHVEGDTLGDSEINVLANTIEDNTGTDSPSATKLISNTARPPSAATLSRATPNGASCSTPRIRWSTYQVTTSRATDKVLTTAASTLTPRASAARNLAWWASTPTASPATTSGACSTTAARR